MQTFAAARWRWLCAVLIGCVPVALSLSGHRGAHAARSMLVPGAGLFESHRWWAATCLAAAIVATVAWLRWGADWIAVVTVAAAMAASARWGTTSHRATTAIRAAHEFPIVVIVAGFVGWARSSLSGVPGLRWLGGRRDALARSLAELPVGDRCRAVAVLAMAGMADADDVMTESIAAPDVARRAARVGQVARLRFGGNVLRRDHAQIRAALCLTGRLGAEDVARFVADGRRSPVGVPASEPTWVRPLDATLAAAALRRCGELELAERWANMLDGPLRARRGHRPAWWWTPLGIAAGRCLPWEHAAMSGIAHAHGWIDSSDWALLRRRALGAAARGVSRRDDERLIAAGRIWLAQIDDAEASAVLSRPNVCNDPLAVAFDRYAEHLRRVRPSPE